jgi:hypothetical protein
MPHDADGPRHHNTQNPRWTDDDKMILRHLEGADDVTLMNAFPTRSIAAIRVAQMRCTTRADDTRPPTKIDGSEVRRRLRDLPITTFIERLPDLLKRSDSFGRPLKNDEGTPASPQPYAR